MAAAALAGGGSITSDAAIAAAATGIEVSRICRREICICIRICVVAVLDDVE